MTQKCHKQAEAKRDGVINPQNYNFNQFLTREFLMLSNATNQPKSIVELGYMCPRGLLGLAQWDKIKTQAKSTKSDFWRVKLLNPTQASQ